MNGDFEVINESNWKRNVHCQIFRESLNPLYCVTFDLDVTDFLVRIKESKLSFTMSLMHVIAKCANEIDEFRYRFLDGAVVLYKKSNVTFTFLDKNTQLFKVVNVEMQDNLNKFVELSLCKAIEQDGYFIEPSGNDVFHFSPMPWVSYTQISHTYSGKKESANPLFNWGKYYKRDGRLLLPFSVQVHHSFVDGFHIGLLADSLQNALTESR